MLSVNKSDSTFEDTKEITASPSPTSEWKIPPIDMSEVVFEKHELVEPAVEGRIVAEPVVGVYIPSPRVNLGEKRCTQCKKINPSPNRLCQMCRSYHAEKMRRKRAEKKIKANPILNESIDSTSNTRSIDIMPLISACYSNIHDGTFQLSGTYAGRNITCAITIKPRSNSRENSPSSS